jgi:hypothetical protein
MSTYNLIKVENSTTLQYSKPKITNSIKRLCDVSNGKYLLSEENETFGTFEISTMNGLFVVIMNISVSEIDENSCKFSIEAHNASGSRATQATISGIVNDFLKLMDMKLKGNVVTAKTVKETAGGSGAIWIVILIIAMLIIFFAT